MQDIMFRSILLSVVLLAMFGCKSGVENVDVINVDDSAILRLFVGKSVMEVC